MKHVEALYRYLRITTGVIIALHGLLRIIFIDKYVDFVQSNFSEMIPSENALVIGAALFPFLEFFTGLLIIINLRIQRALTAGFLISLVMSYYIVAGHLYLRLIYHAVIFCAIGTLFFMLSNEKTRRLLIRSAEKSD